MEKGKNSNNLSPNIPENDANPPRLTSKKILTKKDLEKLDEFIQQCLNMFKFVDPKKEFYEATGNEKDLIISHKSTIPDLVIWNKSFNKNECFKEANTKKPNPFPRFQFFLRIKSTKAEKEKKKEKKNEKKEKKNEKKEKNKKKEKKGNNNQNNNINDNNITDNNNNINLINNIDKNNNKIKQLIKPEITNLNDLDLNKITDYNPYHKNNPYKKINMDDNQLKNNQNKIEKNSTFSNKLNETQGNKDINITINNNNYIQNYQLNSMNSDINKLLNINNYPFEYQNNNNIYISAINYYQNQKGWMIIDTFRGNFVETKFTSLGLYQYLSANVNNLKGYKIIENKYSIKLSGDILFNILSQYFESDFKNNQLQKMIQNINLSEIPDFKGSDINMNMNLNQFNINNINNGFNSNNNSNEFQYNNIPNNLIDNNNINNNSKKLNNIPDFFNNTTTNNNSSNNFANLNLNLFQKNQSQSFNSNSNSNSNFFNNNPNFDLSLSQENSNNNLKQNSTNMNNEENELFSAENFFNKELTNQNGSQNKNISEPDQDILDDKNDNEEYMNINNLIFSNTKNINSNSKSNFDINDDINNINDPSQFDSNNDYQYDNYNAIFSHYSNENNKEEK